MYFEKFSKHMNAFNSVPQMGLLYVTSRAQKAGYVAGDQDWSNLGQGSPEVGDLRDGPERLKSIPIEDDCMGYGNVSGIYSLREAVAELYNRRYRRGKTSQYSAENVAISPGGRSGISRIIAALKHINLGHFIPDYTAYAELLDSFRNVVPIPIVLDKRDGYKITADLLRSEVTGKGLGAVLMSNPSNPTGQIVHGEVLEKCVRTMHDIGSTLIIDEFYSHYHYGISENTTSISSAAYIEDINKQSIIIIDGISKNWRYPGLRISWTVGPREAIEAITATGSFLDGGPSHPTQKAVISLLNPEYADKEARSIQAHFSYKRDIVLRRLKELGFVLDSIPDGGFYIFASLENMPDKIRDGLDFFNEALSRKVICVPGIFFDVDPGHRRNHFQSSLANFIRISYGPPLAEVERGLDRLGLMIKHFENEQKNK